jgi:hypothetical protein
VTVCLTISCVEAFLPHPYQTGKSPRIFHFPVSESRKPLSSLAYPIDPSPRARQARRLRRAGRPRETNSILGGSTMSVISNEQRKRDEQSLSTILIFINLALLSAFLLACFYQSFK